METYRPIPPEEISRRIDNAGSSQDSEYWQGIEREAQDRRFEIVTEEDGIGIQIPQSIGGNMPVQGLSEREQYDLLWNKQRLENRAHNVNIYTGSILKRSGRPTK